MFKLLCLLLVATALLTAPPAWAATDLILMFQENGAPVQEATIEIFLSYGSHVTTTDAEGYAIFQIDNGRGFWVEVNGERLDHFYDTSQDTQVIDIATVGRMNWPSGR